MDILIPTSIPTGNDYRVEVLGAILPQFPGGPTQYVIDQSDAPFTITSSTPTSVNASLISANEDHAGVWNVFAPGNGSVNGYNKPYDWHFRATINQPAGQNVKSIQVATGGNIWSTINSSYYPLVVFAYGNTSSPVQLNYGYGIQFALGSAANTIELYGQIDYPGGPVWYGGTMTVVFTDNTSVSVSIPASSIAPPSSLTLLASCSVTPTSQTPGNGVLWHASSTGGTGTYSYVWSGFAMNGVTGPNVTIAYANLGVYAGYVTVTSGSESNTISCGSVTIIAPSSLTVLSPNGGEKWARGATPQTVRWSVLASSSVQSVYIGIRKSGVLVYSATPTTPVLASKGSYTFTPPTTLADGTDYKVRVASAQNASIYDESDQPFSVVTDVTPPSVVQNLTAQIVSLGKVKLSWQLSTDDLSRVGYRVYRNGSSIVGIGPGVVTWTDTLYPINGTYVYTVEAYDSSVARNRAAKSNSVTVVNGVVVASSILLSRNPAVGTQTVVPGTSNAKIGSYAFSVSSGSGYARVNSITVKLSATGSILRNLKLMVGTTQYGATQGTVASNGTYTFTGDFLTPNATGGGPAYVDVRADILSSTPAGTNPSLTTIHTCQGVFVPSLTSAICSPVPVSGQTVVVAGAPSLTVTIDPSTPPSDQLVMGSTGNNLATFRFTETTNTEDVQIARINVVDEVASVYTVKSSFQNLSIYNGGTLVGSAVATEFINARGYIYEFNFATPITVPQANSLLLVLKGDVSSYSSSGATDNTTHIFKIATTTDTNNNTPTKAVFAYGRTSTNTSTVTLSNVRGNTMTVLRSKLTFSSSPLGLTVGRTKTTADNLATLTFTANPAGSVAVNSITVTFAGTAPSTSLTSFIDGVKLIDESGNQVGIPSLSFRCTGLNVCFQTFNLYGPGRVVSPEAPRTWTLRVDSTRTAPPAAGIAQTLDAYINVSGDIRYTDALDAVAATNIPLSPNVSVPILLNSVSYAVGAFAPQQQFVAAPAGGQLASVLELIKAALLQLQIQLSGAQ